MLTDSTGIQSSISRLKETLGPMTVSLTNRLQGQEKESSRGKGERANQLLQWLNFIWILIQTRKLCLK